MVAERLLKRMQALAVGEPLDGLDPAPVGLHREEDARTHGRPVEPHRAAAADPVLAADVRTGQAEGVPEKVGQGEPRLHPLPVHRTVDRHLHVSKLTRHRVPAWPVSGTSGVSIS